MKKLTSKIKESKDLFINGYTITIVKYEDDDLRPVPCYMGWKGWALQSQLQSDWNRPVRCPRAYLPICIFLWSHLRQSYRWSSQKYLMTEPHLTDAIHPPAAAEQCAWGASEGRVCVVFTCRPRCVCWVSCSWIHQKTAHQRQRCVLVWARAQVARTW